MNRIYEDDKSTQGFWRDIRVSLQGWRLSFISIADEVYLQGGPNFDPLQDDLVMGWRPDYTPEHQQDLIDENKVMLRLVFICSGQTCNPDVVAGQTQHTCHGRVWVHFVASSVGKTPLLAFSTPINCEPSDIPLNDPPQPSLPATAFDSTRKYEPVVRKPPPARPTYYLDPRLVVLEETTMFKSSGSPGAAPSPSNHDNDSDASLSEIVRRVEENRTRSTRPQNISTRRVKRKADDLDDQPEASSSRTRPTYSTRASRYERRRANRSPEDH